MLISQKDETDSLCHSARLQAEQRVTIRQESALLGKVTVL